jgi:hypothetical protein
LSEFEVWAFNINPSFVVLNAIKNQRKTNSECLTRNGTAEVRGNSTGIVVKIRRLEGFTLAFTS